MNEQPAALDAVNPSIVLMDRAAILNASDLLHEDVEVPEWGGAVRVKTLTAVERDAFAKGLNASGDKPPFSVALVAASAVDEAGAPLFTPDDMTLLARKSATALERLAAAASRLNRIGLDG